MKKKMGCICCFVLSCVLMMSAGIGTAYAAEIESNVQASAAGQSPRERRALLLGRTDIVDAVPVANVKEMANLMKKCTYSGKKMKSVVKKMDLSKAGIEKAVKETFRDTTWADVSYIYIACHGTAGKGKSLRIQIDKQDKGYTPQELRQLLEKNIKGKVVVLLECCYAGMLLPKSKAASQSALSAASQGNDLSDEFIREFIGTGSSSGSSRQAMPYSAASSSTQKDMFFVLCSSRVNEYSFGQMPKSRFSLATKYWLVGGGWNKYLENGLKMQADKNLDKKVTLQELYNYSQPRVFKETEGFTTDDGEEVRQNVCAYPQNSKMVLFGDYND